MLANTFIIHHEHSHANFNPTSITLESSILPTQKYILKPTHLTNNIQPTKKTKEKRACKESKKRRKRKKRQRKQKEEAPRKRVQGFGPCWGRVQGQPCVCVCMRVCLHRNMQRNTDPQAPLVAQIPRKLYPNWQSEGNQPGTCAIDRERERAWCRVGPMCARACACAPLHSPIR